MNETNEKVEAKVRLSPAQTLARMGFTDLPKIAKETGLSVDRLKRWDKDKILLTERELHVIKDYIGGGVDLVGVQKWWYLDQPDSSIVRHNLMVQAGYTGYCGNDKCRFMMPRTTWNGSQFQCMCGWVSGFPENIIEKYKENKQYHR